MSRRAVVLILALSAALPAIGLVMAPDPPPKALGWSPTGTNVPVEASLVITWSEDMNDASVESAFRLTVGNVTWDASAFQWVHASVPPWTSKATPRALLPPSTNFTATVLPTARSLAGAPLDQNGNGTGGETGDRLEWTFRTERGTPPRVLSASPPNGATNVSVAANLTFAFDEPMDPASVESSLAVAPPTAGSLTWDTNATRATFVPDLYLRYATVYDVRLNGSIATDENGHALDGDGDGVGGDDYAFSFATVPNASPPRVLAVSPASGAANVSVTTNLVIRFSEPMDTASVEAALTYTDGTGTGNASDGAFSWRGRAFPDDEVTFNPFANFPVNDTFTVRLNASVARDAEGSGLDGNGSNVSEGSPADDLVWSFTTEMRDQTPPTVSAVAPGSGATGVMETTSIAFTFSEAMNRTNVEAAFTLRDPVRTWTSANGTFTWGRGNDAATYTPATVLSQDAAYTIAILGSARDVNGNAMGASFTSSFRTRPPPDTSPPHVLSTFPADGETGVPRNPVLSIAFDDPMDRSVTEGAIALAAVLGVNATAVPVGGFQWDGEDHTLSFRPLVLLAWGTLHHVTVSQAARDAAGLPMAASATFAFWVTPWTGRVTGRVVDDHGPVAGATVTLEENATQTDGDGSFAFPSVVQGTYNLTVARDGYATWRGTVTIDPRNATPDLRAVDVGTITLRRAEGPPAALMAGVAGVLLGAVAAARLFVRWRRGPPVSLDEPEEAHGGGEDEAWAEGRTPEP